MTMSRGLNCLLTSDLLASFPFKEKSFSFCLSFKSVNDTDVVSEEKFSFKVRSSA